MSGFRPGDVIGGKFRVERMLGEGGMGFVVAARHLQLGQMVALKFMRDDVCTPEYKGRFHREARNTVRLKSKHVSRVLDVGSLDTGTPYMVMEYLEGTDLSELLHTRLRENQGPLPADEACEYVIQACEAIAEAHAYGIVHRDLKPANLFLTRGKGGEPIIKVLDFGVSKVLDLGIVTETSPGGRPPAKRIEQLDSVVTKATDLLGSPSYMAPEQIISARDADARSDIWSLGVILFRLVSGRAPFQGTSLGELIQAITTRPIPKLNEANPAAPAGLEEIVARCLVRERAGRLGDVTELARLLAPYAAFVAPASLERIALLGPALARSAMVTQPSGPTMRSGAAWTAPPVPPETLDRVRSKDMTTTSAVIIGTLFVLVLVGAAAALTAKFRHARTPVIAPPPTASVVEPPPFNPVPPAVALPSANPPRPSASTGATASAPASARPRPRNARPGR